MTPDEFRATMPAFASVDTYPDPVIQAALDSSVLYVSAAKWDTFYVEAQRLWVADRILTDGLSAATAGSADDATLKTVGTVTVGRSPQMALAKALDPYLRTQYGQRYKALVRLRFGGGTLAA